MARPFPCHRPPPLPLPGLTFLTGGLVGGIGAVGSVVTLQEAVDAAAIAAAELGGVTGARAHWVGQDGVEGEVRLEHRSPSTESIIYLTFSTPAKHNDMSPTPLLAPTTRILLHTNWGVPDRVLGCNGWGACGPSTLYKGRNGLGKGSSDGQRHDLAGVRGTEKGAKPTWTVPVH